MLHKDDIRQEFQVHRLNALGLEKAERLAHIFTKALDDIELACGIADSNGNTRELALVRTHMQTACFYAKRAMSMNKIHQAE